MDDQLKLSLRPMVPGDEPFLFALYASTRADEMALVPWNPSQQEAFLRMQFAAQHSHYAAHHPHAQYDVILHDGVEAGRLTVDRTGDTLLIVDLAVMPAHRNLGIATALITDLQREATVVSKPVQLHVEKVNPARRLYDRLGFAPAADVGVYWLMEWRPSATPAAAVL